MTDTISDTALEDTGGERRARRAAEQPLDHTDGDIMDTPQYLPSNLPPQAAPIHPVAPQAVPAPVQAELQPDPASAPQGAPAAQYQPPAAHHQATAPQLPPQPEYQTEAPRPAVPSAAPVIEYLQSTPVAPIHAAQAQQPAPAAPVAAAPPLSEAPPTPTSYDAPPAAEYLQQPAPPQVRQEPAAAQYSQQPAQPIPSHPVAAQPDFAQYQQEAPQYQQHTEQYQHEVAPIQHQQQSATALYQDLAPQAQAAPGQYLPEQAQYQTPPTHGGYQQQAPVYQEPIHQAPAYQAPLPPLPTVPTQQAPLQPASFQQLPAQPPPAQSAQPSPAQPAPALSEYQQATERVLASRMEFTPLPSPVSFEPQPQQNGFAPVAAGELFKPREGQPVPQPAVAVAPINPSEFEMQRDSTLNADAQLDAALSQVVALGASDLHIAVNAPPMIRVDGGLRQLADSEMWSGAKVTAALRSILTSEQQAKFDDALEFDFAYTLSGTARFRVNFYQQRDNMGAAFRLIPTEIKSLQQLGVPESIAKFAQLARGLVLVTGPTGSGKSTTLAGLIDLVNRTRADHIMTVEDPIEFLHDNHKSLINQREVGHDTHSFGAALKHVLRQDPDVILVGELRDLETISVALTAAETGHLVFATLHTSDAPQTIDRIIDVYPPHQQSQVRAQLAATLQGVVCQTLIKKSSGKGRVVATEVLVRTNAVANLIREGKTFQIHSAMQAGRELGMHTIDQHLADLVSTGQITMEAAKEKAHDLDVLERLSGGARVSSTGGNMNDDMSYGGGS